MGGPQRQSDMVVKKKKKSPPLPAGHPACSIVIILTELSQLPLILVYGFHQASVEVRNFRTVTNILNKIIY
jgi:hypothetical protein